MSLQIYHSDCSGNTNCHKMSAICQTSPHSQQHKLLSRGTRGRPMILFGVALGRGRPDGWSWQHQTTSAAQTGGQAWTAALGKHKTVAQMTTQDWRTKTRLEYQHRCSFDWVLGEVQLLSEKLFGPWLVQGWGLWFVRGFFYKVVGKAGKIPCMKMFDKDLCWLATAQSVSADRNNKNKSNNFTKHFYNNNKKIRINCSFIEANERPRREKTSNQG